jgi:hypothetical protein
MANFTALAPHLAAAGVHLKPSDVREIITEQRSAAAKVLFHLREFYDASHAKRPRKSVTEAAGSGTGWVRESAEEVTADPARRAEIEFIRKALLKGAFWLVKGSRCCVAQCHLTDAPSLTQA